MRRIAATLLLAISGVSFADEPSVALGYQFLPLLPAGFSLSTFGAFGQFGIEGSLNAGGQSSNQVETVRFSVSLGSNLCTPIGLYPSLAISAENVRQTRGDDLIENRTDWAWTRRSPTSSPGRASRSATGHRFGHLSRAPRYSAFP